MQPHYHGDVLNKELVSQCLINAVSVYNLIKRRYDINIYYFNTLSSEESNLHIQTVVGHLIPETAV